ncbi:MAG: GGDEF domain-containing protein, partial [Acidimicrobiales bacterium]
MAELNSHVSRLPPRHEVLDTWRARCRERSADPEHCSGPEAAFLVTALGPALRRGSTTPALARAGRSWGARCASPAEAVATLACLREVLAVSGAEAQRVLDHLIMEAVEGASALLRAAARTDPLTACANRLALDEELGRAVRGAVRSGLDVSVAVLDLDGLKGINDTEGHAAGDACLLALVDAVRGALRSADSLYRVGGDEFVVLAPYTDIAGTASMLRRAVHFGAPAFSWGVASLTGAGPGAPDDPQVLLQAADADLYARRRQWRRTSGRAGARRRTIVAAAVAGAVLVVSGSAAALAVDLGHGAGTGSAGSGGAGIDTPVPPMSGSEPPSGPFHWPLAVIAPAGLRPARSSAGVLRTGVVPTGTEAEGQSTRGTGLVRTLISAVERPTAPTPAPAPVGAPPTVSTVATPHPPAPPGSSGTGPAPPPGPGTPVPPTATTVPSPAPEPTTTIPTQPPSGGGSSGDGGGAGDDDGGGGGGGHRSHPARDDRDDRDD